LRKKAMPRIGIHMSTSGGILKVPERAHSIGANTMQIFSSSPRMWRPSRIPAKDGMQMRELLRQYDCDPLVIHASYLVNLCSQSHEVRHKSISAFRGEVERALAIGAKYLVLHPGSWRGLTREEGLRLAAESIEAATSGLDLDNGFRILIENTAGAEFSLGSSFEQVAELIAQLKPVVPVGACIDTCHCHVAGYDLVSKKGYEETLRHIDATIGFHTVRVLHMNDAKAVRGSKLDRHEHVGMGTIGFPTFRRLLSDPRLAHCAFISETPVTEERDEASNVRALLELLPAKKRESSSPA
jgi:deoxyribonuclease IV